LKKKLGARRLLARGNRYFKFWSVVNENLRGLIPTLLFDSHWTEQHPRDQIRD
jgi:hypothetical protein